MYFDARVISFLEDHTITRTMRDDILSFLRNRIPEYIEHNRNYLTIAVGCTGGQHRSVYLVEKIARELQCEYDNVLVRHNELRSMTEAAAEASVTE